jgi:pSer/pThr/pTyr-binding forkhead associated (FHA) protein
MILEVSMNKCPNCGQDNLVGEFICKNCGLNMLTGEMTGSTAKLKEDSKQDLVKAYGEEILQAQSTSENIFPESGTLRLEIIGSPMPIKVKFSKSSLILGRRDPATGALPDVDLAPFAGYRMGVSRRHSEIRRTEDGYLELIDLGSSNGTFLNGQRLSPHTPYRLQHRDRMALGQIVMEVIYQSEVQLPKTSEKVSPEETKPTREDTYKTQPTKSDDFATRLSQAGIEGTINPSEIGRSRTGPLPSSPSSSVSMTSPTPPAASPPPISKATEETLPPASAAKPGPKPAAKPVSSTMAKPPANGEKKAGGPSSKPAPKLETPLTGKSTRPVFDALELTDEERESIFGSGSAEKPVKPTPPSSDAPKQKPDVSASDSDSKPATLGSSKDAGTETKTDSSSDPSPSD